MIFLTRKDFSREEKKCLFWLSAFWNKTTTKQHTPTFHLCLLLKITPNFYFNLASPTTCQQYIFCLLDFFSSFPFSSELRAYQFYLPKRNNPRLFVGKSLRSFLTDFVFSLEKRKFLANISGSWWGTFKWKLLVWYEYCLLSEMTKFFVRWSPF